MLKCTKIQPNLVDLRLRRQSVLRSNPTYSLQDREVNVYWDLITAGIHKIKVNWNITPTVWTIKLTFPSLIFTAKPKPMSFHPPFLVSKIDCGQMLQWMSRSLLWRYDRASVIWGWTRWVDMFRAYAFLKSLCLWVTHIDTLVRTHAHTHSLTHKTGTYTETHRHIYYHTQTQIDTHSHTWNADTKTCIY